MHSSMETVNVLVFYLISTFVLIDQFNFNISCHLKEKKKLVSLSQKELRWQEWICHYLCLPLIACVEPKEILPCTV